MTLASESTVKGIFEGYFEGIGNVRWDEVAGDMPDEMKLELGAAVLIMPLSDTASIGSGGVKRGAKARSGLSLNPVANAFLSQLLSKKDRPLELCLWRTCIIDYYLYSLSIALSDYFQARIPLFPFSSLSVIEESL